MPHQRFQRFDMYLHCIVGNSRVTALLDSHSSINIVSRTFYNSVPEIYKSDFMQTNENIMMADNGSVAINGTARIQFRTPLRKRHDISVYILTLSQTSPSFYVSAVQVF